jgi:hypothetical protein
MLVRFSSNVSKLSVEVLEMLQEYPEELESVPIEFSMVFNL